MRLLSRARRQRRARRPPGPPPRALARAHRPDARLDPAGGVRRARRAAARGRRRPATIRRRSRRCPTREAVDALRVEYRRLLLRLAARDLAHHLGVDDVAAELSDLAAGTLEAALAVARARVGDARRAGPARRDRDGQVRRPRAQLRHRRRRHLRRRAGRGRRRERGRCARPPSWPRHLMRVCSDHTGEGTIWPVDAALRPEGKAGPLVRTLASHRGYYERWAKTWEFQALLKARPVAGDLALGPRVRRRWSRRWSGRPPSATASSSDVQAMRRRVVDHIPAHEAERQLKLGSGGLRDVEFAVQLLQLVHGRADERVRAPTTLSALAELTARRLRRARGRRGAARGLRVPAHARAPDPAAPAAAHPRRARRRGVAAPARPVAWASSRTRSASSTRRWQHHRREVRRLHEKLFYRPLLAAVARIPGDEARLSPEAAERAARRARLRRPAGRAAPPRGADRRGLADRADPAHAAAGDARVVRRRARPGRRAVRLPPDQRGARRARPGTSRRCATRARSPSGWPGCWRPRRYATDLLEREPQGVRMLGGRPDAADRRGADRARCSPPPAGTTDPRTRSRAVRGDPAARAAPDRGRRPARR